MSLKLYELPAAFAALYDAADADGEVNAELERQLAALEVNLGEKVNGICQLRQQWLREVEACKAEQARLRDRIAVKENAERRIKLYLQNCLEALGLTNYETDLFKVRVALSPVSVEWTKDNGELPLDYQRTEIKPDLAAAKEDLKAGKTLPEGFEVHQSKHLRIT